MNMIRFTPYAWAKLLFMRDRGSSEVGGYGISSIEDPLLVTDFRLVKQEAGMAHFEFDDEGLAEYAEEMAFENELQPAEFQRILIHTHPGSSAAPSGTDETNFDEKMSDCSWSIMFILAKGGQTTCALKYKNPAIRVEIGCMIDFLEPFDASCQEEWEKEYEELVNIKKYLQTTVYPLSKSIGNNNRFNSIPHKARNHSHHSARFDDDGGYGFDDGFNDEYDTGTNGLSLMEEQMEAEAQEIEEELIDIAEQLGCTVEEIQAYGIDNETDKKHINDLKNGVR